ncbi:MAG: hypothetical protein AAF745_10320, partial [Planctomycetota bacterium]
MNDDADLVPDADGDPDTRVDHITASDTSVEGSSDWAEPLDEEFIDGVKLDDSVAPRGDSLGGDLHSGDSVTNAFLHDSMTHFAAERDVQGETDSFEFDSPVDAPLPIPEILGGYRVGRRIGRGGMG